MTTTIKHDAQQNKATREHAAMEQLQTRRAEAINTRKAWRPVLRPVARLVIAAQLALALQPLSVLAQEKGQQPYNPVAQQQLQRMGALQQDVERTKLAKAQATEGKADTNSRRLARAHELVRDMHADTSAARMRAPAKSTNKKQEQQQQLQGYLDAIEADSASVLAEFEASRAELQARRLPSEALARHDQAALVMRDRAQQFSQLTAAWKHNPSDFQLGNLARFFEQYPAARRHTPIDPGKLPWGAPKGTPRMPAETKTAWYQQLTRDHKIQLAQAGGMSTIGGVRFTHPPEPTQAPQDADLAETADIQLTPAIRAKAQELNHNPVAISNWVHNTIQYLPTWGSIQGAEGTLKTLRGNAFDTTSLTIALLRASGIPARYQFGTVDIPVQQAMNWVGGVNRPEAALNLLYQGGVAARGISSGGQFATIRMEHVWVNAYVNWSPSRGARDGGWNLSPKQHPHPNANLNAWVPLDTSFKQYTYTSGMNLQGAVPIDASALLAEVQQGASVTPNYAQNLNQANLQSQLTSYQNRVKAHIDSTPTGANSTVGDVLGGQTIQTRNLPLLPGALATPVVVAGNERAEIPDALRWKVALRLYQSDSDRANDSPSVSVERPLAQLAEKRIAISFEPATPGDQAVVDAAAQAEQTSFGAYLTRYVPRIKLDFDVLGAGYAQQPGIDGMLNVVMRGPTGDISRDYRLVSGDTSVLSLNATGTPADKYTARARDYAMNALDTNLYGLQGLAEEMLHQLGLAWWAQKHVGQDSMAAFMGVVQYALPSHTLLLAPVSVRHFFGVPRSASYKSRAMDAKLDYVMLEQKDGDQVKRKEFVRAAGKLGSYLEGAVFDQAFNPFNPDGVSTISLIGQAHAQGVKVYTLRPGDESLVAQLQTTVDVQDEILNALATGREVTVPQQEVSLGGYTGLGFVIEDPSDGSAAYQIDGGRSGAQAKASDNVIPIPQMPDSNLISILLGSQLRQAGAKLAVDGGMIVGLVLPQIAIGQAGLGALLGLLILLMLLAQTLSTSTNQTYPEQLPPKRFRHYTNVQSLIRASGYLLFSNDGATLGGGGVYVADANAEELRGVTCANLDPLDIVTRFQIPPPPSDPDPTRVTGFVEITESLRGWLYYESKTNSTGQLEYIIRRPVAWVINPRQGPGQPPIVRALLLLPFGPASITDVCN